MTIANDIPIVVNGILPLEIERLKEINLWGITHSTYRDLNKLNPKLQKFHHVLHSLSLELGLRDGGYLLSEERSLIRGEVSVHDVNTTGCTCHFDRGNDNIELETLRSEIKGKGPFQESTLPEWIDKNFGVDAHKKIAIQIEQGGKLHRIAESIENLSHMILDAPYKISNETYGEIKKESMIDTERGGLFIPESVIVNPYEIPIKEFLSMARRMPLEAYMRNPRGFFYESVLRRMMESVIDEHGRDLLYTADDKQWYKIFSEMSLDSTQRLALDVLKTRKLPFPESNGIECYIYTFAEVGVPDTSGVYESFKVGKRKEHRTKLESELNDEIGIHIYLFPIENGVGEECIYVNGEDFQELRLLSLGVFGSPVEKRSNEASSYIQKKLNSSYFGPLLEKQKSEMQTGNSFNLFHKLPLYIK